MHACRGVKKMCRFPLYPFVNVIVFIVVINRNTFCFMIRFNNSMVPNQESLPIVGVIM